jgi:acetyltransferase-like isoleucine patch superfamily enzyme
MNDVYIHPAAIVETRQIGPGTRIWAFTHVMTDVSIGQDCNIGEHCFLENGVTLGNQVTLKNGNMLWTGVHLEDGVFVGPQVVFTNDLYPRSPRLPQAAQRYSTPAWLQPTRIAAGASVGAGAVIVAGVTIHEFALVAAGAVVTRDVLPHALVIGSPARLHGWVCQCGQPLQLVGDSGRCRVCGQDFIRTCDSPVP